MAAENRIVEVMEGSIGEEAGIERGDFLLQINGSEITDVLDYMEWMSYENIQLLIRKAEGEEWEIDIEKEAGEDLGLKFEYDLMDKERSCRNKCVFCFIDQLPEGMRDSLYYKDDDWRLSFLMGNYITLTNVSDCDIERIIEKRISPLYISVHTTNPELRKKMLNNRFAGDVLKYMYRLIKAGIRIHCQIVLCPGWNDGEELEKTLTDLWALHDSIESVAAVPVGLTSHRYNLAALKPFTEESAAAVIDKVEAWQKKCRMESGNGFIYASDEFYIKAGRDFPTYESYDEFPQIENGVGLTVQFRSEFDDALTELANENHAGRKITIVTGVSAAQTIKDMAARAAKTFGKEIAVVPVENNFFGKSVTVAGLTTGRDIIEALKGRDLGDKVLIPHVMLRRGEDVFLDDTTLEQLCEAVGVPVVPVPVNGMDFLKEIIRR